MTTGMNESIGKAVVAGAAILVLGCLAAGAVIFEGASLLATHFQDAAAAVPITHAQIVQLDKSGKLAAYQAFMKQEQDAFFATQVAPAKPAP